MRIGYAPYSPDLSPPADRRRFPFYARERGLEFELADPDSTYDLVVATPRADLQAWSRYRPGQAKVVFDIVDSYLDFPRWNPKAILRGPAKFLAGEAPHPFFSYRRAVERMLERADAAVCATPEQAALMAPLNANIHAIIDFQSDGAVRVKDDYRAGSPFQLVWEGLPNNADFFGEISSALAEVHRRHPLLLHIVAPLEYKEFVQRFWLRETYRVVSRHFDHVKLHEWSAKTVSDVATSSDVAVIPLPIDRRFVSLKSENKLISFWQMGLPTVTSATPAYARAMSEAGQDLACATQEEWIDRLLRLIDDQQARRGAGQSGREFAEREYSNDRLMEAWDGVFGSLES